MKACARASARRFVNFVPNAAFRSQVLATSPALAPLVNAYPMGTVPIDSVSD